MLTLLSPAKSLNVAPHVFPLEGTEPRFLDQTAKLLKTMKRMRPKALSQLMDISKDLSLLNFDRYQRFEEQASERAVFLFDGDVYDGLSARTLDESALLWAQDRLRILSGLYGLLRPLDQIKPYRLEMGSAVKSGRSATLYQFWGDTLSKSLLKDLDGQDHRTIVNLASQEYSKAVVGKALKLKTQVITVRFLDIKGNEAKIISFFAKKARGMMARFMIDNRIDRPDALKDFKVAGYAYRPDLSTIDEWTFCRPQPPLLSALRSRSAE